MIATSVLHVMLLMTTVSTVGDDAARALELERQALANRLGITRGEIILRSVGRLRSMGKMIDYAYTADYVFDPPRRLLDLSRGAGDSGLGQAVPSFREFKCDDGTFYMDFTSRPSGVGDYPIAMGITEKAILERAGGMSERVGGISEIVDARLLGFHPTGLLNFRYFTPDKYFGNPEFQSIELTEETYAGLACWKTTKHLSSRTRVIIWLAQEQDLQPVRVETEEASEGRRLRWVVESVLKPCERGTGFVWFPQECRLTVTENDVVTEEDLITIQSVSFRTPPDPERFTLAGLKIPPGTPIVRSPATRENPNGFWNGEKVVPHVEEHPTPIPRRKRGGEFPLWPALTGVFAIVSLVLGGVLLRQQMSR
jgi:hypothetical protein